MKRNVWFRRLWIAGMILSIVPYSAVAEKTTYLERDYYFREPGPVMKSQLYLDGSTVEFETGYLIYPVIGSDLSGITPEEFRNMALASREAFENAPNKTTVSPDRAGRGINIVFNCSSVPSAAIAALESVAVYIEQLFADDVTVSINVTYAPLSAGVIGQAQSYLAGNPSWTITRNSLQADMDADDSIELYLPATSTIPVRYTYGSGTVTNEDRVYFLVAPYNAVIGSYPSPCAQITFNTNMTFDYDPRDGVSGICFQSVAVHEVGHVLGFVSNADGYGTDIDVMDIYRFQLSDGTGDFNPDDWSEFGTTARMVDLSTGADDVNSDMIAAEYRMSDGDPYQASHFSQGNVNAIMQPAFSSGMTFYPYFFRVPDRVMFDAIGWDYVMSYYLTTNASIGGSVTTNPSAPSYPYGTSVELTAIPDAGYEFLQWTGDLTGSVNPTNIIMDYDKSVTAIFQTENCTLTVNILGNGTVIRVPNLPYYPRNSEVELTAVPDPGWVFSYWFGNLSGSQNPDTIIMNGDKTVTARFVYTGVEEGKLAMAGGSYFNITPNPASSRVEMRYSILSTQHLIENPTISIYDATGRTVKCFSLESITENEQSMVIWQGDDSIGRKLPDGVYFIEFKAGDFKETQKLLLIH